MMAERAGVAMRLRICVGGGRSLLGMTTSDALCDCDLRIGATYEMICKRLQCLDPSIVFIIFKLSLCQ